MAACGAEKKPVQEESIVPLLKDPITATKIPSPTIAKSRTALYLDSLGLKDVQSADSGIIVKLMYATADNFTGQLLYDDLKEAYLHPDALTSLIRAQRLLKEKHPEYSLIVYEAVDVSIVNENGEALPMGTEVDHLGIEAHITHEVELVKSGRISKEAYQNRLLLRQVMKDAGFRALNSEWWHFNRCSREEAKQRYKRIENIPTHDTLPTNP